MTLSTRPDVSSVPVSRSLSSVRALVSGVVLAAAMAVQPSAQATPVIAPSVNSLAPETITFPYAEIASLNVGQGGSSPIYFVRADFSHILVYMTFQPLTISDATQAWGSGSYNDGTDTYTIALDALSVSLQDITHRPNINTQFGNFSATNGWAHPNNISFDGTSIELTRTTNTHTNAVPEPSSLVLMGAGLAGLGFAAAARRRKEKKGESETV